MVLATTMLFGSVETRASSDAGSKGSPLPFKACEFEFPRVIYLYIFGSYPPP